MHTKSTQLRFTRTVEHPGDQRPCQFIGTMTEEGVDVAVQDSIRPSVTWDKLTDVEYLSQTYWMLRVWEFRVVVELLAEINDTRNLLKAAA